jgi:hypothetical protein
MNDLRTIYEESWKQRTINIAKGEIKRTINIAKGEISPQNQPVFPQH